MLGVTASPPLTPRQESLRSGEPLLGGRSYKLVVQRSGCLCHCGEEGGTESSDCQTAGSVAPGPPCEPCWGTGRLEPGLS